MVLLTADHLYSNRAVIDLNTKFNINEPSCRY